MTWVRIDDGFSRHPKVVQAGPLGMAMQVAALCYCNQYLTDGFVPAGVVPGLLDLHGLGMRMWKNGFIGGGEDADWAFVTDDLLASGLWEQAEDGYRIHDYDKYQPSKEQVLAERESSRRRQETARSRRKSQRDTSVTHREATGVSQVPRSRTRSSKELYGPERSISAKLNDVCPDCGETLGAGCLETCPRMPAVTA